MESASTRLKTKLRLLVTNVFILSGCSATQRISEHANDIRSEAQLLASHGQQTGDKTVVDAALRIDELAANIHEQLPGAEDRVPAWLSTVGWIAIAVVSVAVVIILWQTGIGTAIRIAIGWIPRRKIVDAELATGMLDPSDPENAREYVAARRASDPEFDAAWRRLKKRKQNAPAG